VTAAKRPPVLADLWRDEFEREQAAMGPEDLGVDLVRNSLNLGTVVGIGLSVGDVTNPVVGRIAFKTETGSFVMSLPPEFVAMLAANMETMMLRTAN